MHAFVMYTIGKSIETSRQALLIREFITAALPNSCVREARIALTIRYQFCCLLSPENQLTSLFFAPDPR